MTAEATGAAVRVATSAPDVAHARRLFVEYAQWLGVDLCFQDFAAELENLPGAYAPPRGCLLLAGVEPDAFACIALRPLKGASVDVGEVKRLYVQPRSRGQGWGRRLVDALIARARSLGYRELKLDTLERMTDAHALYSGVGFRECAAYYANPLPDVVYMSLQL